MKSLSDPKSSSTYRASTIKSATADQVPKRNVPDEPQKKITEITQLDQSKSTTIPGVRIKTKTLSERVEAKLASKDPVKKEIESRTSQVSDSTKPTNEKSPIALVRTIMSSRRLWWCLKTIWLLHLLSSNPMR